MTERRGMPAVLEIGEPVVRVVVASVEGSTPREAGAAMLVTHDGISGTIGGGQLEFEAVAHARSVLANAEAAPSAWLRDMRVWPLGPSLGQCCGGAVRVLFEHFGESERAVLNDLGTHGVLARPVASGEAIRLLKERQDARALPLHAARVAGDMLSGARPRETVLLPARRASEALFIEPAGATPKPLFIYGAGHVGRAIVKTIADLDFAVNWVDVAENRFPASIPEKSVTPIISSDPAAIAAAEPDNAYHLVLTYSHALDLAICNALLARPTFGFLGLIGSVSKRARFMKRLREGGIAPDALERLICPIGIGNLRGKQPATIAISVAAQLIETLEAEQINAATPKEGTSEQTRRKSA
ncbi:MAG: xanthine dehydrogenase accessory protein XdhC [Rhodomicrobiaceae bacterium]